MVTDRETFNRQNEPENTAASSSNPYALIRFCCTNLYTKDHAQLCGVVSFSLFLCLVVISLMIFHALSIFYILIGIIVYSLLMKSLFGLAEKLYILFYLLFEAVQIGFYLALILFFALPLLFFQIPNCEPYSRIKNGTLERGEVCREPAIGQYMELSLFILILLSVKLHFARVFAHFYKYLVWNEKIATHSAQYMNGRGVQIDAFAHMFPPPPPSFWDNPVVRDHGYGYDQQQTRIGALGNLAELPSYAQAIGGDGHHGEKRMVQIEEAQIVDDGGNGPRGRNDGMRLNLHV